MEGDPSAGNFFKNLFGPNVSIVSSEDANSVVARNNGLSVDEFFQPFSCVGGKEPLTSRDVGGNLHSVSNIKIQFKNLTSKNISQDEIDRRLQDPIDKKTNDRGSAIFSMKLFIRILVPFQSSPTR